MEQQEKILTRATLGFACNLGNKAKVLLAKKARKMGKGLWNGYGGGIENGESPKQAMVRELWQESGLIVKESDLYLRAIMDFHNVTETGKEFTCRVYIYLFWRWQGEARATEEMGKPVWFPWRELPLNRMMPADRVWLPKILIQGDRLYGEAWYGPKQKELLRDVKLHWWRGDLD